METVQWKIGSVAGRQRVANGRKRVDRHQFGLNEGRRSRSKDPCARRGSLCPKHLCRGVYNFRATKWNQLTSSRGSPG
ncbi:hypothetical protein ACUXAV_001250 [Cupriavidus metallidurans]